MSAQPYPRAQPEDRFRVLLLENIHPSAHAPIEQAGLELEILPGALKEHELIERIADVHVLGIRSKTRVSGAALARAKNLLALGCYCIGTNQVDVGAANLLGIPVFNAPFANTRSVAEMIIAEIVFLARQLGDRSMQMHQQRWHKSAKGSFEVRGKTLGIVGYGHIGSQVGVLAEAMGMRVLFHDIVKKLPMGNNRAVRTLAELLPQVDFLTLHVPATQLTRGMIGAQQLLAIKPGARLLNASRGTVVQIGPLADALRSGRVAGAAIDVFPEEPEQNQSAFASELQRLPNVILTPHVGGATVEAQEAIGKEATASLLRFLSTGTTLGSVNFPQVDPPPLGASHRIVNIHRNVPGVLSKINQIVSEARANVESQVLATDDNIGYLVMDLDRSVSDGVRAAMSRLETDIRTRVLR